jgi:phenylacetate-CoA ligase
VYGGARCQACRREHIILRAIAGRWPAGNLVARDGSIITMTALNVHDRTFAPVQQFQFVQNVAGSARLLVVPAPRFGYSDLEAIRRGLARKLAGRIDLEIEMVERIPLSPRGKAVYVDQRIATEQSNERQ